MLVGSNDGAIDIMEIAVDFALGIGLPPGGRGGTMTSSPRWGLRLSRAAGRP
jgi:hypothetical protein